MNLAGFCRNCLSNWMKEEADAKGVAVSKDESREAVYGMPYEDWKAKHQGTATPGATGGDEEGPSAGIDCRLSCRACSHRRRMLEVDAACVDAGMTASAHEVLISCGRAVDERDVSLTQGAADLEGQS